MYLRHVFMNLFLKYTVITLLITSCHSEKSELKNLLKAPKVIKKDSVELTFFKNVNILYQGSHDDSSPFLRPYIFNGRHLYAMVRAKPKNYLILIDIEKGKIDKKIELTDKEILNEGISTFYVHSRDSIFFQTSNTAKIILIDSTGSVISRFETSSNHDFVFPSFLPHHIGYVDKTGLNFYCTISPVGFLASLGTNDSISFQGVYNLEKNKWVKKYGKLEGIMKEKDDDFYPPDLSLPYNLILDDKAFVNYPMDHFIYVYDLTSGNLMTKLPATSEKEIELSKPLPSNLVNDRQEIWNFRITCSFYEPLLYHSDVELFTRAIHLPQALKTDDGKLNSGAQRQTILLIFNKGMELIGEQMFYNGEYSIHGATSMPNGILLQSNTNLKDTVRYKVFHFNYKK